MAEEDTEAELDDDEAEEGGDEEAPSRKKKLIRFAIIGAGALVLLSGGGGAAYMFGLIGGGGTDEELAEQAKKPVFYYDLPEMTVNLNSADKRQRYLKLRIALEASDQKTIAALEPALPRLLDAFQVYLRELRTTDLDGSAGMHRLKEELTRRVNIAIYPNAIDTVLFREIIVQ